MDNERERFEAWFNAGARMVHTFIKGAMWEGWQERAKQSATNTDKANYTDELARLRTEVSRQYNLIVEQEFVIKTQQSEINLYLQSTKPKDIEITMESPEAIRERFDRECDL